MRGDAPADVTATMTSTGQQEPQYLCMTEFAFVSS